MNKDINDVLAELFYYLITIMTKFRMVAEHVRDKAYITKYNNKQSSDIFLATTRSTQRYS
eukprot:3161247-Amphidinium_carterae.1